MKEEDEKTVKPIRAGKLGVAGGDKFICGGVLFKFACDVEFSGRWIYGGKARDDELAMKSVNHELRGIIRCEYFIECLPCPCLTWSA